METKRTNSMVTTLATGVIVGSLVLAGLTITGCSELSASQMATLAAEAATKPVESLAVAARLSANHNETFLVCPQV